MKNLKLSFILLSLFFITAMSSDPIRQVQKEFPKNDFSNSIVQFEEIISGGPPKDGIPAIDTPQFAEARNISFVKDTEPVISIDIGGDKRAYPLSVLMHHEIVNDTVRGRNIAVTYCPLCNSSRVFVRDFRGRTLDFGTTGRLRNSDLVMYDRQTETWWQQFTGQAIVGEFAGARLKAIPAKIESFKKFKERAGKKAKVLTGDGKLRRNYGTNFYYKYDSSDEPFLYIHKYTGKVPAMSRVVAVGDKAWSLDYIKLHGTVRSGDLIITRVGGQNSALDTTLISEGRDVGNITVKKIIDTSLLQNRYRSINNNKVNKKLLRELQGKLQDVAYDVPFTFAFKAFYPNSEIITE